MNSADRWDHQQRDILGYCPSPVLLSLPLSLPHTSVLPRPSPIPLSGPPSVLWSQLGLRLWRCLEQSGGLWRRCSQGGSSFLGMCQQSVPLILLSSGAEAPGSPGEDYYPGGGGQLLWRERPDTYVWACFLACAAGARLHRYLTYPWVWAETRSGSDLSPGSVHHTWSCWFWFWRRPADSGGGLVQITADPFVSQHHEEEEGASRSPAPPSPVRVCPRPRLSVWETQSRSGHV